MTPARDGRGSQCRERRRNPRGRQVTGRGQRHEAGGRRAPHTAVRCPTSARFSGPSARPSSFQCRWGGTSQRGREPGLDGASSPDHLVWPSRFIQARGLGTDTGETAPDASEGAAPGTPLTAFGSCRVSRRKRMGSHSPKQDANPHLRKRK